MPIIQSSTYPKPPFYLFNGHLQTIIPSFKDNFGTVPYRRERLELSDGDFVDLDWVFTGSKQLAILAHGLEGDSERPYMRAMAKYLSKRGWDICSWNCRSCSGELNRHPKLYYHGEIEDIGEVVDHAVEDKKYDSIALIGFSMGGCIILKYLGVNGDSVPDAVQCGIAFSAPCDIPASIKSLEKWENYIFRNYYMKNLESKMRLKALQFPEVVKIEQLKRVKRWSDFDTFFSAPLNGFNDLDAFYFNASAKNFIEGIKVPTLLVNAKNDPVLGEGEKIVESISQSHPYLYLERPSDGGHCGFRLAGRNHTWMEVRAWSFITNEN